MIFVFFRKAPILARFWSTQTGNMLAEYEALRAEHLALVGQTQVAVVASAEQETPSSTDGAGGSTATTVELESVAKLEESPGIEHRVASECSSVELILDKNKAIWLLSSAPTKTIAKHIVLGGFGTGQWLPEADCSEPGVAFACPQGDQSLIQIDESSMASEAQGFSTLSLYKLLVRVEAEKGVTEHRMSFLDVTRKPAVEAGSDGFEVKVKSPMTFRCLRDPRAVVEGVNERLSCKNFFSKAVGPTLPQQLARTVFRYRFERVGQNFKIQRPYVVTASAVTLQKDKPFKLT